ncbi:MAG: methyl-accepting chemotaxis protein [Desulfomonile tiedjei]|uniref:Methyl-accepting chemotaxis protein n=1 Tax=Desulfomonile tiedjei TaxID=2358 RepID=A0A9D6Z423_9BACT|nr:methyl-accepting chemotaxis protein [Desulfomonile tiedjei]
MIRKLVTGSLMRKLVACFVLVSAAQIPIVGYLSFDSAKTGLEQAALNKLDSERELRKNELLAYFLGTVQNLRFMAQTPATRSAAETLQSYHEYNKSGPDSAFDTNSELFKQMYASINPFFKSFLETHEVNSSGYDDIYLISGTHGIVMFTAMRSKDLGADLRRGDLKGSSLTKLYEMVLKTKKPSMVDFSIYAPLEKPALFMGVPILGEGDAVDGVLVMRMGPEKINSIFGSTAATGRSTDAYLVGHDFLMRSQSRSEQDSSMLRTKINTEAVKNALQGKSGTGLFQNSRNATVLTSYSPVGLNDAKGLGADFDWAAIAEINADEAFASVQALKDRVILIALIIAALSVLVAFVIAGTISKPVVALAEKVAQIGEGDLTSEIPHQTRDDELGALATAIDRMVRNLREQIARITEGVVILSSSASEISTTVAEVAASSAQTSSAMTETTVTVEELRQAAQRASERAKSVATNAQESVKTSAAGKQATDDTTQRMRHIKEQMTSMGQTVVRLSEHSRAIEEIMASVQDLADQSNLLAVNASIEAARAGEHGKGFAVVAHEIKNLADQSRDATGHVRSILEETRKWVNAVVMSAEEGIKAVEGGVRQSILAGESIEKLYADVEGSARAANEIQLSSDQQSVAIDQVSGGISSIDLAIRQNVSSTSQLESAAKRLADLGGQLKDLVERYRI